MSHNKIRVILCEDDSLFRKLLTNYLNKEADLEVLTAVGTRSELMQKLENTQFDVLLLDIHLTAQNYDGVELALELHTMYPLLKIIILSSIQEEELITHVYTYCQITNYITKEHYKDTPNAIREAYSNKSSLHYSSANILLKKLLTTDEQELKNKITPRQVEILQLLDQGYNHEEIANALFYSKQSVSNEIFKISVILKGKFPYLAWLRLRKYNTKKIVYLAKKLKIIP